MVDLMPQSLCTVLTHNTDEQEQLVYTSGYQSYTCNSVDNVHTIDYVALIMRAH
jgi:hypothetical protein